MINDYRWLGYAQSQNQMLTPKTNYLGLAHLVGTLRLVSKKPRVVKGVAFSVDNRMWSKNHVKKAIRRLTRIAIALVHQHAAQGHFQCVVVDEEFSDPDIREPVLAAIQARGFATEHHHDNPVIHISWNLSQ
jgi:hypothetical protein